jgi:hypothetical protein
MSDETNLKILEALGRLEGTIGEHRKEEKRSPIPNVIRGELLAALVLPIASIIGVYIDINTRLVIIESAADIANKEIVRNSDYHDSIDTRTAALDAELIKLNASLVDLTSTTSQSMMNVGRRLRALEKK